MLKKSGHRNIQDFDFIVQDIHGNRVNIEIKGKRLYEPGPGFPHFGIGLNKSQLWLRTQLLKDKGERTILINYVEETDYIYAAYLDELEKGFYYDTPKEKIRVYPVDNFKTAKFAELILDDPGAILRWLEDERQDRT